MLIREPVGPGDDLLTLDDVAERLRRPVGTLRQWRHRKYGPQSFLVGGKIAYRRSDVDAWLAEQLKATASGGES